MVLLIFYYFEVLASCCLRLKDFIPLLLLLLVLMTFIFFNVFVFLWIMFICHRLGKVDPVASLDGINSVVDSVATLNINPNVDLKTGEPTAVHNPVSGISDCKCGMPLCICEVPAAPVETVPLQV